MDRRTWIGWLVAVLLAPFLFWVRKPKESRQVEYSCRRRKHGVGIDPAKGPGQTSVALMCREPTGWRVISVDTPKSWKGPPTIFEEKPKRSE